MMKNMLPFTYWSFAPETDEPAHGYAMRLIDAHGINSVVTFNIWNEIESDAVSPPRSLSLLERHPLPIQWIESLRHTTPCEQGRVTHMGGQMFSAAQISQGHRRWCPGCTAERACHRNWWDIVALRKCPIHDVEFVKEDSEGNAVSWTWPQFGFSRAGWELGQRMPRKNTEGFGRYVLGRLGHLECMKCDVLDDVALRDVIDAAEIVGKFLSNPRISEVPKPGVDDIDRGFAVVRGGGPAVAEAVRDWLKRNPLTDNGNPAFVPMFGWVARKLSAIRDASLQSNIRRAFHEARAFEVSGRSRAVRQADFELQYMPMSHLARDIGLKPTGLTAIAEELGIRQSGRMRGQIAVSDAKAILGFVDSLIGPDETARRLGIHKDALRHLVHAGHLKVFKGLKPGTRNGAHYDLGRVARLIAMIDELPVNGDPNFGITFDLFRKRNKLVPGVLALEVLDGNRVVAERRTDAQGFKSLMIQSTHRRQRHAFGRDRSSVTVGQAEAILNLSHVTVMILVKQGLLGPADIRPRFTLLTRSIVTKFGRSHAKVADFAPALGLHPIQLYKKLTKAGVNPVVAWNHNGQRTETVVRRQDVVAALGIERDPSVIYDQMFQDFWTPFVAAIRSRCPYLFMPDTLPFGGQRAWQNSTFSAVFKYNASMMRLLVELVPYGGQRQFLELDVSGGHADVPAFLDRLVLAIEGVQEFVRVKARERYRRRYEGEAMTAVGKASA